MNNRSLSVSSLTSPNKKQTRKRCSKCKPDIECKLPNKQTDLTNEEKVETGRVSHNRTILYHLFVSLYFILSKNPRVKFSPLDYEEILPSLSISLPTFPYPNLPTKDFPNSI